MFDNPNIFYFDRPSDVMFDQDWKLDSNKISKLKDHKLVIADFSSEHYGDVGLDGWYQHLEQQGINFLMLTHNPDDHQRFNRMLFYPYWYHWARKSFIVSANNSVNRKYKWSCLNSNPRTHRIYNYFYSQQQPYFKDAFFTFHDGDVHRTDDVILSDDASYFWESIRNTVPHRSSTMSQGLKAPNTRCDLPSNFDSYVHLVTETTVLSKVFVSEKTWKPIASGQLFLIFGSLGTISYLRKQGVDVFDDIIDHSYDHTVDWQLRLHQIHQQLERLLVQDLKMIYINTHARRQANIEKFFSGAFDQQYKQSIIQCINTLS